MINDESTLSSDRKANRSFYLVTDATTEPVSLTELKEFAKIDTDAEDTTLTAFIQAARKAAELYTGRSFMEQTWRLALDWWPSEPVELPCSPVLSISSVTTVDEDGTETTYASSNYFLDSNAVPARLAIRLGSSPPSNEERSYAGYRISYVAGYGSLATDVPETLRLAVKQWATAIYEQRAMSHEPPTDVRMLLDLYRIVHR